VTAKRKVIRGARAFTTCALASSLSPLARDVEGPLGRSVGPRSDSEPQGYWAGWLYLPVISTALLVVAVFPASRDDWPGRSCHSGGQAPVLLPSAPGVSSVAGVRVAFAVLSYALILPEETMVSTPKITLDTK